MQRRENTFRIDYANIPRKPSYEDLHDFVNVELGLKKEEVLRIQPSRTLQCAFVKVTELALAQKIVEEHDDRHETEIDGKTYKVRIRLEDGAVEVRVHDLSEDVSDEVIIEYLRSYGDVLAIREQVWDDRFTFGGIPTGVRLVKMMVKENIPSFVTIDGETTAITYYGQQQTCRHCSEYVHNGISCVQNKKLLVQKLDSDQSYAKVVKQQSKPKPPRAFSVRPKPNNSKILKNLPSTSTVKTLTVNPPIVEKPASSQHSTVADNAASIEKPPSVQDVTSKVLFQMKTSSFKLPQRLTNRTDEINPKTAISEQDKEGEDTDRSTTSTQSRSSRRRPLSKKIRHEGADCDSLGDEMDTL